MKTSIYTPHSFHSDIIRRAVWMYFCSNFSLRDIEELIIERGVDVSYETIRRWDEGTVLDVVQRRRNTKAATRLLRKLLRNQGVKPERIVTDKLGSYGAALKEMGMKQLQDVGGRKNNRAECSHVPTRRRERKAPKFRSVHKAQKLLSADGQIYNLFNHQRHLISRSTLRKFRTKAQNEWNLVTAQACA